MGRGGKLTRRLTVSDQKPEQIQRYYVPRPSPSRPFSHHWRISRRGGAAWRRRRRQIRRAGEGSAGAPGRPGGSGFAKPPWRTRGPPLCNSMRAQLRLRTRPASGPAAGLWMTSTTDMSSPLSPVEKIWRAASFSRQRRCNREAATAIGSELIAGARAQWALIAFAVVFGTSAASRPGRARRGHPRRPAATISVDKDLFIINPLS